MHWHAVAREGMPHHLSSNTSSSVQWHLFQLPVLGVSKPLVDIGLNSLISKRECSFHSLYQNALTLLKPSFCSRTTTLAQQDRLQFLKALGFICVERCQHVFRTANSYRGDEAPETPNLCTFTSLCLGSFALLLIGLCSIMMSRCKKHGGFQANFYLPTFICLYRWGCSYFCSQLPLQ